jgi:hypothetical protein
MAGGGSRRLAGAIEPKPLRQGSLSRLCGLYAIINAIVVATHGTRPLKPQQRQWLYDQGIIFLSRRSRLETVMLEGMNERLWMRLRDHLLTELAKSGGPRLRAFPLVQLRSRIKLEQLLDTIAGSIDEGAPVLVVMWGAYDHFTVVVGHTPTNLLLFDSYGFRWVARRSIGLRRPRSVSRHQITCRSIAAIVAYP